MSTILNFFRLEPTVPRPIPRTLQDRLFAGAHEEKKSIPEWISEQLLSGTVHSAPESTAKAQPKVQTKAQPEVKDKPPMKQPSNPVEMDKLLKSGNLLAKAKMFEWTLTSIATSASSIIGLVIVTGVFGLGFIAVVVFVILLALGVIH